MICSFCNQFFVVPIVYGYPTPELIEASRKDQLVLGGCNIKEYTHYCLNCNKELIFEYKGEPSV
jgi:hypothetical protein